MTESIILWEETSNHINIKSLLSPCLPPSSKSQSWCQRWPLHSFVGCLVGGTVPNQSQLSVLSTQVRVSRRTHLHLYVYVDMYGMRGVTCKDVDTVITGLGDATCPALWWTQASWTWGETSGPQKTAWAGRHSDDNTQYYANSCLHDGSLYLSVTATSLLLTDQLVFILSSCALSLFFCCVFTCSPYIK